MNFEVKVLGCPKNLIDSEFLTGKLMDLNYKSSQKQKKAVFLMTCAFLKSAIKESEDEIKQLINEKSKGKIKFIGVGGCLPHRLKEKVLKKYPQIDLIFGFDDIPYIDTLIQKKMRRGSLTNSLNIDNFSSRFISTSDFAYLRLSEGCNEKCSFCVIPQIRGNLRSKPIELIAEEAESLVKMGRKEIVLISQSTGQYGKDIYGKPKLKELLQKLLKIKHLRWIRLLYLHPADLTDDLFKLLCNYEKICRYIDIPVQHISEKILRRMQRRGGRRKVLESIKKIRNENFYIRTEIIVGFPGETEKDFEELKNFVQDVQFERLAIFPYSSEKGTPAYNFRPLPKKVVELRLQEIEKIQKRLLLESQKKLIGKKEDVIIQGRRNGVYIGRTQFDAPEIDCNVFIHSDKELLPGEIYPVLLKKINNFDLIGDIFSS